MPRTSTDHCIELRTANSADRVALRGVRLLGRMSGMSLRATLEQTFVNLEDRAIEAVYTFPLPEQAAVCGFEVVTADRLLTGAIDESDVAEEKYDDAIAVGHGAFMAEQHRPDVFSVRVGNLKPKQAATIRLTYVMPLERVDRQIRAAFPTTIAPRYATATATDPIDAAIDGDALNPPHVLSVPYGLSMRMEIDLGRELLGVFSPSHAIDVSPGARASPPAVATGDDSRTGEDARAPGVVTFAGAVAEMNRDLVLTLQLTKDAEPSVQAATGPDGANYLAVTFVPEFAEADPGDLRPSETIFVLDCSGSMMGQSIEQARAALELCLRSLSPGDTFNICRFGSSYELMASEPLVYSQATFNAAIQYVRRSRDLGGTELHAPLEAILKPKPLAGSVRQIILLTDGQVTNEPAIVELARKHRKTNRVFTFGIGSGASAFLVRGIARATGGAAEFITDGERIDDKVLRTFARLASPMVEDVALDWDGADMQTLAEIPPVFDGDVLAVFARCAGPIPRHVSLSCRVGGGRHEWKIAAPPTAASDENVIATMWARRTIQSLEEVAGQAVWARKQKLTREQETIVRLSKEFNLLSSLTTFIAIERRSPAERNAGDPETRRVPVMLAEGWGGMEMMRGGAAVPAGAVFALAAPMAMPAPAPQKRRGLLGKIADSLSRSAGFGFGAPGSPRSRHEALSADLDAGSGLMDLTREDRDDERSVSSAKSVDDLQSVFALQDFDGAFVGDPARLKALCPDVLNWVAVIEKAIPPAATKTERPRIVMTAVVLLLLRTWFASEASVWQRAAKKALRTYLPRALGQSVTEAEAWLSAIKL